MLYGILKGSANNGLDFEIACAFSTPLTITSNQPAFVQDTMNLRRKVSSQGVQRWELNATIAPENGTANFLTHSVSNGHVLPVYIRMPQVANLPISNSSKLALPAIIGATKIYTQTALTAGEFIQIDNDKKVYLVVNASSDGKSLTISPGLVRNAGFDYVVKTGGTVTLRAYYDSDVQLGITFTDGVLSSQGSVRFIEAIE